MVNQGDIIMLDFDPSLGHEQKKHRPALVVSNGVYNQRCNGMAIVCPISHAKDFPLHIDLPDSLKTDGKVLCEHLRAMDIRTRTYRFIERVPQEFLDRIQTITRAML